MPDPLELRDEEADALAFAVDEARHYLAGLDEAPVLTSREQRFGGRLPEDGDGALVALRELVAGSEVATRSSGPRFFHFVTGGTTPAALAADWLTSLLDQNAFSAVSSPLGAQLEEVAVRWLLDLFDLPEDWSGVLTSGATMANFVGLACGRRWWAQEHGVDVDEQGFAGLPAVPVFSTPYLHASARKALGMVGLGRDSPRIVAAVELGRELAALKGAPAIVIANAGDVNTGDFDPIARFADLAEKHRAWLHVDGAFGLFARLTPEAGELAEGVERADSVIADGHKWLNVPYDCGFAFVRDGELLKEPFRLTAAYLPSDETPSPEASRRARSLAVWATLRAYGRAGHRAMVERHLGLAQRLGRRVEEEPELELLAPVRLNIVCFRHKPAGMDAEELDAHNLALGDDVLADGRVFFGTTRYEGAVAFRPAIVNWRTTERDVDLIADVLLELGTRRLQAG
ncbi:MAG TPA: pyridoxal-dependent decarboxylase [Gaiellaceae bacterium]|jgi:glutamate/tyrosine decarboxylase-like PLP-dependent enzyme|nr:pyridoxal-dependent decarboxylase [Gaiellaceae bacterium]